MQAAAASTLFLLPKSLFLSCIETVVDCALKLSSGENFAVIYGPRVTNYVWALRLQQQQHGRVVGRGRPPPLGHVVVGGGGEHKHSVKNLSTSFFYPFQPKIGLSGAPRISRTLFFIFQCIFAKNIFATGQGARERERERNGSEPACKQIEPPTGCYELNKYLLLLIPGGSTTL